MTFGVWVLLSGAFFLLLPFPAFSQQRKIDSLEALLKKEQPDTSLANIYSALSYQIRFTDHERHKTLAKKAIDISRKSHYSKGLANGYNMYGIALEGEAKYEDALKYYDSSLTIWKQQDKQSEEAKAYLNMANVYDKMADYPSAADYCIRSLRLQENLHNTFGVAVCKLTLGNVYYRQGDVNDALRAYEEAWRLNRASENNPEFEGSTLSNIGSMFEEMNQQDSALFYYRIALHTFEEKGMTMRLASTYNNVGKVYEEKEQYDSAMFYHRLALKIQKQMDNPDGMCAALTSIGTLHRTQGNLDSALIYYNRALLISKQIKTLNNDLEIYYGMSKTYELKKQYEESLHYLQLYNDLNDSLHGDKQMIAIERVKKGYEIDKKNLELMKTTAEKKLADEQNRRNVILFSAGGFVLLLIIAVIVIMYNNKQRHNEELARKNKEISGQKEEITASITYAKKIQEAIFPGHSEIARLFPDSFVLWKPRDIVSGDFIWFSRSGQRLYVACADCTGHGVPGAMVSVVGVNLLNHVVTSSPAISTGEFLDRLHAGMLHAMNKEINISDKMQLPADMSAEAEVKDGMDIGLLCFDYGNKTVEFSGAARPLYYNDGSGLKQVKAERYSIGGVKDVNDPTTKYTTHAIPFVNGSTFYLFSDGFADQFGESTNKKFMTKRFFDLISSLQGQPMSQQAALIEKAFLEWKGRLDQVDDVLVLGMQI